MIKASQILECYQIELVEQLEDLLQRFFQDMLKSGLKPATAEKHVSNAELFLIEYHAFYFLDDIKTLRPEKVYDFLGVWYFQKVLSPSKTDLSGIMISLKRFLAFAADQGVLPQTLCQQLKNVCGEKDYFMQRFQNFQQNPNLYVIQHDFSDRTGNLPLYDLANRMTNTIQNDALFTSLLQDENDLSLDEMVNQILNRFQEFQPKNNVIHLDQYFCDKKSEDSQPSNSSTEEVSPRESLKDHCLDLHRANLIFLRWLDRFDCSLADLPAEGIAICMDFDTLLSYLFNYLESETIPKKEILVGHHLLDLMDKMLWVARQQIVNCLGLDLRSLPL